MCSRRLGRVGDSSAVEPAPRDTQALRGCGFESHCSPPAGPSCYRCAPTCLETESNPAPHMAASPLWHCNFSMRKHTRRPRNFNELTFCGRRRLLHPGDRNCLPLICSAVWQWSFSCQMLPCLVIPAAGQPIRAQLELSTDSPSPNDTITLSSATANCLQSPATPSPTSVSTDTGSPELVSYNCDA